MVEKIYVCGATELLPFALRAEQLTRLVRAVVLKRPRIVHAIVSLLSDATVLSWLAAEQTWAGELSGDLLSIAADVDNSQLAPLGIAFARLVALDEKVASKEGTALHNRQSSEQNTPIRRLSAASLAARCDTMREFLDRADSLGLDTLLSTEISFWFMKPDESDLIASRLIDVAVKQPTDAAEALWRRWCNERSVEQVASAIFKLLSDSRCDHEMFSRVLETCFSKIAEIPQGKKSLDLTGLVAAIRHHHSAKRLRVTQIIVKWLAYFINPQACGRDDEWFLDKTGNVAIQAHCQPERKVTEIIAKLRVHGAFALPSSRELSNFLNGASTSGSELVSDGFGKGFTYADAIRPGQVMRMHGSEVELVSADEMKVGRFQWRARLNLKNL